MTRDVVDRALVEQRTQFVGVFLEGIFFRRGSSARSSLVELGRPNLFDRLLSVRRLFVGTQGHRVHRRRLDDSDGNGRFHPLTRRVGLVVDHNDVRHSGFVAGEPLQCGGSVVVGPRSNARDLSVCAGYAGRSPASLFVVGLVVAFVYSVSVSEPRVTNRASSVRTTSLACAGIVFSQRSNPGSGSTDRAAVGNGRPNAVGRKPEHLRKPSFGRAEGDGVAAGLPRVRDDVAEPRDGEFLSVSRRRDGQSRRRRALPTGPLPRPGNPPRASR